MLSKESRAATRALIVLILLSGCSYRPPWQNERRNEVNVAFSLEKNVVMISAAIEGKQRHLIVATGTPRSVLNGAGRPTATPVTFGGKTSITVTPDRLNLAGIADGILGADAWEGTALTLDYDKKLLTIDLHQQARSDARPFPFHELPTLPITVDGQSYDAVIDTSSPDTLLIPWRVKKRAEGIVTVGSDSWGRVDYQLAKVSAPRIGNRLLSKYLVTIDYRTRQTYLWKVAGR
ncbi:MAG TPA: hypothetical protein VHL58_14450 [Thermoanaerobaculia bacterium]|nr:hypothetical protein [Thermoanaerobaculia bacterium]